MEKILIKTACYSFVIGLVLMIIFVPRGIDTLDYLGNVITIDMNYADYFFMIGRYALIFASFCTLAVFILEMQKRNDGANRLIAFLVDWVFEPLKSFVFGFAAIISIGLLFMIAEGIVQLFV